MRPRTDRVVVAREPNERILPSGIVIPGQELGLAYVGRVTHAGPGRAVGGGNLPLEIGVGDRIVYSTRIDTFGTDDGGCVDLVEEASIIGRLQ